ncbi:collagen triple helix repeat-containing protein 1-like [Sycon ciliatum]|uniref:collagen triple helix repeat-containing protein 1-like n=1 Tax=Sycon ciliatum TaxID=27933 RepID=UPI0031F5F3ED
MEIQNGKTKLLGTSCNLRTIGYKYQSQHNLFQENDVGQLASITITKKRSDTVLKLSYSSSIRTQGALAATRWYFQIDGQECRKPTPIDIGMWQETADNTHVPAVLTGICESIAESGAALAAGQHTVTVRIGQMLSIHVADAISGWHTASILEVQEMCPQY